VVAVAVQLSACDALDRLISVDAPSRVLADDVVEPGNAALLVNSAGTDFECAFSHYIVAGGLVGNELEVGTTLIAWKDYDRRAFDPGGAAYTSTTCDAQGTQSVGVYIPLSVARWQADNALSLLDGWTDQEVPDRARLVATAAAYSGYSHVLLAEGMCSAAFDLGPEVSPTEILERAENRFTRAIEAAEVAGDADILSLARVGRARARLDQGSTAAAAEDARLIPEGFRFDATYSTDSPRRENNVFRANQLVQLATIDPTYRNRTFEGVTDPRIAIEDTGGPTQDGTTALWHQLKYPTRSAPIPIASWEEARLIVAEAELEAGNDQAAVAIINDLHDRAGLPPFDSTDPEEVMEQIIWERAAELFLQSHHLGDLNRYDLPFLPPPGSPFKDGGTYGEQTCFPLPAVERLNNPNIP
jgi:hypothetical protein